MKTFEKYSEDILCNEITCDERGINCKGLTCEDCQKIRQEAWRAALEAVMRAGMHHYGNDFLTDMSELSTEIRIELGELDEQGKVIK